MTCSKIAIMIGHPPRLWRTIRFKVAIDVELAIAQGVMEAQKLSEGKNAKEVNRLAEDMNKMLQAERLKIRRIEACLRRLTRIRDKNNPRPGGATQFEGKPRSESKPAVLER